MGINIKLAIQVFIVVFIFSSIVMAFTKFIVLPVKLAIDSKPIEIVKLKQENKKLVNDLTNAKAVVIASMNEEELKKLKYYISDNTQVLTDAMIEEVASSLITYSNKHEVPIALVVGIAQATSNFNTTYLSEDEHRGILALSNKAWKNFDVNVNYIKNGANIGCITLRDVMKKTKNVTEILTLYFDDLNYTTKYSDSIFKYSLIYTCYRK